MVSLRDAIDETVPVVEPAEFGPSLEAMSAKFLKPGQIHDPGLGFFRHAQASDVVCDVGASFGLSLVSLRAVGCRGAIHCFEINPAMAARLETTARSLGGAGVTTHPFGLGADDQQVWLYVPAIGAQYLLGEASIYLDFLKAPSRIERMQSYGPGQPLQVVKAVGEVRRLDGLGIEPQWVKLSAVGAEPYVLDGMRATLEKGQAVLAVANFYRDHNDELLRGFGYEPFMYDVQAGVLRERTGTPAMTYYLTAARHARFKALGQAS